MSAFAEAGFTDVYITQRYDWPLVQGIVDDAHRSGAGTVSRQSSADCCA